MSFRPASLLPIPQGNTAREWISAWLTQIAQDVQSTHYTDDNPNEVRNRNERFGSYLPTLSTVIEEYEMQCNKLRVAFEYANPKPEKGITEWRERREQALHDLTPTLNLVKRWHEDIASRISTSQTALRTSETQQKRV
jgi:hypothetical protein